MKLSTFVGTIFVFFLLLLAAVSPGRLTAQTIPTRTPTPGSGGGSTATPQPPATNTPVGQNPATATPVPPTAQPGATATAVVQPPTATLIPPSAPSTPAVPSVPTVPIIIPIDSTVADEGNACGAPPIAVAAFEKVNVRSGPDEDFEILVVLGLNEAHPISNRYGFGEWWQIEYAPDAFGWVANETVAVLGYFGFVPVIESPLLNDVALEKGLQWNPVSAVECSCAYQPAIRSIFSPTNIRSGPSSQFSTVGQLDVFELRPILGRFYYGEWWLIQFDDATQGWVSDAAIQTVGNISQVPGIEPPLLNGSEMTNSIYWQPAYYAVCNTDADVAVVVANTATPEVAATTAVADAVAATETPVAVAETAVATAVGEAGGNVEVSAETSATIAPTINPNGTAIAQEPATAQPVTLATPQATPISPVPEPQGGNSSTLLYGGAALALGAGGVLLFTRKRG